MIRLLGTVFALGLFLSLVAPASAVNRYVDDSGTDTPGCTNPNAPCRNINFAVGQSNAGDVVEVGAATNHYQETVALDSGVSLRGSDFNPPATSSGPPNYNRRRIDGGVGFAIVVEPGSARTIEGFEVFGGPGAIRIDTASGIPATLAVNRVLFGEAFSSNPDEGRLVLADGLAPIHLTVDEGFWCCPTDSVNRRAIDDVGTNPVHLVVRNSDFQGYQSAIRLSGGEALISNNYFNLHGDAAPAIRAAIDLTDSSATIERNNFAELSSSSVGDPPELAIRIDNTGPEADRPILRQNSIQEMTQGAIKVTGGAGDGIDIEDSLITDNPTIGLAESPPYAIDASGLGAGVSAIGLTMAASKSEISGESGYIPQPVADVIRVENTHLTLDSSILDAPIVAAGGATCTIRYSRGPSTAGDSCQRFQTNADPGWEFFGRGLARNSPLVDAGNPAIFGTTDASKVRPRSLDGNGDGLAVRDMGAFERLGITLPDTEILLGPQVRTRDPRAVFFLKEINGYYTCSLDGAPPERCSSPVIYTGLKRGKRNKRGKIVGGRHTFSVYATTIAGAELIGSDPTPAVYNWTVLPPKKSGKKKSKKRSMKR